MRTKYSLILIPLTALLLITALSGCQSNTAAQTGVANGTTVTATGGTHAKQFESVPLDGGVKK